MTAGTNEFVPFATGAGANVYPTKTYAGLAARASGVTSGIADPDLANNAWRQATSIAAMIGQFVADYGGDALDDGDLETLQAHFKAALHAVTETDLSGYATIASLAAYLLKSGGTMTGALTLAAAPSADLHAATKKYVDDLVALTGVDLSGYLQKAGGTLTGGGHISDPINPTSADHLVRKGYVDALSVGGVTPGGIGSVVVALMPNGLAGSYAWSALTGTYAPLVSSYTGGAQTTTLPAYSGTWDVKMTTTGLGTSCNLAVMTRTA